MSSPNVIVSCTCLVFIFNRHNNRKIVRPSANQINCDFIVDGLFFCFNWVTRHQVRTCLFRCSTLSLMIVGVDCVMDTKSVYLVTPIRQPISMATRWQHSSSYWTIGNIVNCWHQHRTVHSTVMLQYEENCLIVARLGLLDKCGRRNAVWFLILDPRTSTSTTMEILRGFLHLNVSPYLSTTG